VAFVATDNPTELLASVSNGQGTDRYLCKVSTCIHPMCMCTDICLEMQPLDYGGDARPHVIEMNFSTKTLKGEALATPDEIGFARNFLESLRDEDYVLLVAAHFTFKNRITESAEANSIDADFDFAEIEMNGAMCAYNDVLPFGNGLEVVIDGKSCLIVDQYCILPKCSCSESYLSFQYIGKDATPKSLGTAAVDFKKKIWKPEKGDRFPLDIETLRTAVEGGLPDIYGLLRARQSRLKDIYACCRKRYFSIPVPLVSSKVGRNDPCPCGSGLKFKKCCAGKAS
jgi:hypothetical protein